MKRMAAYKQLYVSSVDLICKLGVDKIVFLHCTLLHYKVMYSGSSDNWPFGQATFGVPNIPTDPQGGPYDSYCFAADREAYCQTCSGTQRSPSASTAVFIGYNLHNSTVNLHLY